MPYTPEMADYFSQLEQRFGLPRGYMAGSAKIESNYGDAHDRRGSQFQGMFQLGAPIRQKYGVTNPSDWHQNALAAAQLGAENMRGLSGVLHRDPTAAELYLAHQQGLGGARNMLTHPDAPAGSLTKAQFIAANGGDPRAPASAFMQKWASRFGEAPNTIVAGSPAATMTPPAAASSAQPVAVQPSQPAIDTSQLIGLLGQQEQKKANPFGTLAQVGQQIAQSGGNQSDDEWQRQFLQAAAEQHARAAGLLG